jgi:hypothetical protein
MDLILKKNKSYHPMYAVAGFDLTTPNSAGGHDNSRPRRKDYNCNPKIFAEISSKNHNKLIQKL